MVIDPGDLVWVKYKQWWWPAVVLKCAKKNFTANFLTEGNMITVPYAEGVVKIFDCDEKQQHIEGGKGIADSNLRKLFFKDVIKVNELAMDKKKCKNSTRKRYPKRSVSYQEVPEFSDDLDDFLFENIPKDTVSHKPRSKKRKVEKQKVEPTERKKKKKVSEEDENTSDNSIWSCHMISPPATERNDIRPIKCKSHRLPLEHEQSIVSPGNSSGCMIKVPSGVPIELQQSESDSNFIAHNQTEKTPKEKSLHYKKVCRKTSPEKTHGGVEKTKKSKKSSEKTSKNVGKSDDKIHSLSDSKSKVSRSHKLNPHYVNRETQTDVVHNNIIELCTKVSKKTTQRKYTPKKSQNLQQKTTKVKISLDQASECSLEVNIDEEHDSFLRCVGDKNVFDDESFSIFSESKDPQNENENYLNRTFDKEISCDNDKFLMYRQDDPNSSFESEVYGTITDDRIASSQTVDDLSQPVSNSFEDNDVTLTNSNNERIGFDVESIKCSQTIDQLCEPAIGNLLDSARSRSKKDKSAKGFQNKNVKSGNLHENSSKVSVTNKQNTGVSHLNDPGLKSDLSVRCTKHENLTQKFRHSPKKPYQSQNISNYELESSSCSSYSSNAFKNTPVGWTDLDNNLTLCSFSSSEQPYLQEIKSTEFTNRNMIALPVFDIHTNRNFEDDEEATLLDTSADTDIIPSPSDIKVCNLCNDFSTTNMNLYIMHHRNHLRSTVKPSHSPRKSSPQKSSPQRNKETIVATPLHCTSEVITEPRIPQNVLRKLKQYKKKGMNPVTMPSLPDNTLCSKPAETVALCSDKEKSTVKQLDVSSDINTLILTADSKETVSHTQLDDSLNSIIKSLTVKSFEMEGASQFNSAQFENNGNEYSSITSSDADESVEFNNMDWLDGACNQQQIKGKTYSNLKNNRPKQNQTLQDYDANFPPLEAKTDVGKSSGKTKEINPEIVPSVSPKLSALGSHCKKMKGSSNYSPALSLEKTDVIDDELPTIKVKSSGNKLNYTASKITKQTENSSHENSAASVNDLSISKLNLKKITDSSDNGTSDCSYSFYKKSKYPSRNLLKTLPENGSKFGSSPDKLLVDRNDIVRLEKKKNISNNNKSLESVTAIISHKTNPTSLLKKNVSEKQGKRTGLLSTKSKQKLKKPLTSSSAKNEHSKKRAAIENKSSQNQSDTSSPNQTDYLGTKKASRGKEKVGGSRGMCSSKNTAVKKTRAYKKKKSRKNLRLDPTLFDNLDDDSPAYTCPLLLHADHLETDNASISSLSSHLDSNLDYSELKDSTDEEELPDVFAKTSTLKGATNFITRGSLVWTKFNRHPYWPSLIKHVYTKKTKIIRVTVIFLEFGRVNERKDSVTIQYKDGKILPFSLNDDYAYYNRLKEEGIQSESGESFRLAFQRAEDFIMQNTRGGESNSFDYFREEFSYGMTSDLSEDDQLISEHESDVSESSQQLEKIETATGTLTSELYDLPGSSTVECSPSRGDPVAKRRLLKNEKLIHQIRNIQTKAYLMSIYRGNEPSELHILYHKQNKTKSERSLLKVSKFGPISDECQEIEITDILMEYSKDTELDDFKRTSYVFEVWLREAIVYAIHKVDKVNKAKAWTIFEKGATLSEKESKTLTQNLMSMKHTIAPEDRERYQLSRERRTRHLLMNL